MEKTTGAPIWRRQQAALLLVHTVAKHVHAATLFLKQLYKNGLGDAEIW